MKPLSENALKERLKFIANERQLTFNEVWKTLLLERFLARLFQSDYRDKFIFKGGLLLAHYIELGRETIDVDFLLRKLKIDSANYKQLFNEIVSVPIEDGFSFSVANMESLVQPHMKYAGYRISLAAKFSGMKDRMQVDLGVGDIVEPELKRLELLPTKASLYLKKQFPFEFIRRKPSSQRN